MAIPRNRQELLEAINTSYARLQQDLARVPPGRARELVLDGHMAGTRISVCDLLAYLVGWNELVLHWHAQLRAGKPVADIAFPAEGFTWNQLGALAQRFYADHAHLDMEQLLQRLALAKRQLVALLEASDDAQLYGQPWYKQYSMGRMIQFNTSSPYANARTRLRAWLNTV